jgi:hypothetical protein
MRRGGESMGEKAKETLEKQLQLLSERAEKAESSAELCQITEAMVKLVSAPWPCGG